MHSINGDDSCRVHVRPSAFPVEATVTVDNKGQFEEDDLLHTVANGTRPITDPESARSTLPAEAASAA